MLKNIIAVMVITFSVVLIAQNATADSTDFSHLMSEKPTHWWDVSFGCSELAPDFFSGGQFDSLLLVLQYWEENTSYYEPVRRMWMLYQIHSNDFDPDFISPVVVEDLYAYQYRVENQKDSSDWYLWDGDKTSAMISSKFNDFTQQLAADLLHYDDLTDDEWLLCLFYSHNFDAFWSAFEKGEASRSKLYRRFHQDYKESTRLNLHYDVFGGWYSPRKDLNALGGKIKGGISAGFNVDRFLINGTLAIRAINPEQPYNVGYHKEIFETRHYLGVYVGIEPGFNLYQFGRFRFDLLGGAALDIIEAIPVEDNPYEEESVDLFAANLNLGIGARFFLMRNKPYFIRWQLRYEFAGYNTHGGTDLSDGEALTIRLGFGWAENARKYELQKYFER